MHPNPHVRRAIPKDLPDLLAMVHALAAHHGDTSVLTPEVLLRDLFGDPPWITALVATNGAGLSGYAVLTPMTQLHFGVRGMDMHHLFVKPECRGAGVGRALLKASIAHAKSQHCAFLTVGTAPDNPVAQAFYLAAGLAQRPASGPRFSIKWNLLAV